MSAIVSIPESRRLIIGSRNDNPAQWTPFAWDDPLHRAHTKGEVAVTRPQGTSGSLTAGLWRTGHHIASCDADQPNTRRSRPRRERGKRRGLPSTRGGHSILAGTSVADFMCRSRSATG